MTPDEAQRQFRQALEHTIIAFRYFDAGIPAPQMFTNGRAVQVGIFKFEGESQAESMRVELGWAFFVRLEASLEAFCLRIGIDQAKKSLADRLDDAAITFPNRIRQGLSALRELRNILHHGDGDPSLLRKQPSQVRLDPGHEPLLFADQIKNYYELFKWLAEVLPKAAQDAERKGVH